MESEDHFDDDFLMRVLRDPAELKRSNREDHLHSCEVCKGRLRTYQSIQSFLRGEADFEVPTGWLARMIPLIKTRGLLKKPEADERYAWLAFDSLLAVPQGIRSASVQRYLLWESQEFRVDMMVQSADPRDVQLVGQLKRRALTAEPGEGVVEAKVGNNTYITKLNTIGEFIVSVGRMTQDDPIEVRFRLKDRPTLTLLIPF